MEDGGQEGDPEAKQQLALWLLNYVRYQGGISQNPEPPHHSWLKHGLLASSLIVLVLALIWVGGNVYGAKYELLGMSLSARSSNSHIEAALHDKVQDYRLTVMRPDGTSQAFSPQEMGLEVDVDQTIAEIRKARDQLQHRLKWWLPISAQLVVRVDDKALETFIKQHISVTIEPAQDASIGLVDGKVQVTEGVSGKQYGLAEPENSLLTAVRAQEAKPLVMHMVALAPGVSAADLAGAKTKLESVLAQSVVLAVGEQQVRVEPRDVAAWISVTPDPEHKDVKIDLNQVQIRSYIDRIAGEHSRPARAQVTLASGEVIAGSNGVSVTNTDAAIATVSKDLLKAEGIRIDLPIKSSPFKAISAPTAGKWIEVDVTNKRMHAYEQATLVRTFLVSAGKASTPTVTGTFTIYRKLTIRTMTGPGYSQPNVPWVNYFYRDYAIHGNYWRPARYFGNINSSHGCVGLRVADSAWVYDWAPVGTPVVIHL